MTNDVCASRTKQKPPRTVYLKPKLFFSSSFQIDTNNRIVIYSNITYLLYISKGQIKISLPYILSETLLPPVPGNLKSLTKQFSCKHLVLGFIGQMDNKAVSSLALMESSSLLAVTLQRGNHENLWDGLLFGLNAGFQRRNKKLWTGQVCFYSRWGRACLSTLDWWTVT